MKFHQTEIPGLIWIEPNVIGDARGYFFESYNKKEMVQHGIPYEFVQDNESYSARGVLRGLHFQKPPFQQGKLVRVAKGQALDVAVDIRVGSPTFGKWKSFTLSGDNKHIVWIPPGFAHGFLALEDDTIFIYKCTNLYNKESEDSIRWNDPDLGINWQIGDPTVSEKDSLSPLFRNLESEFTFIENDGLI